MMSVDIIEKESLMSRFFVDPAQIGERRITISGNDVNHIKNVLRMEKGEDISVSDGHGKMCIRDRRRMWYSGFR